MLLGEIEEIVFIFSFMTKSEIINKLLDSLTGSTKQPITY
jgi:hypothetical protein